MIAIMQKAATLDDTDFEQNLKRDRENISRLIVENRGLRELLQISRKYGASASAAPEAAAEATAEAAAPPPNNNNANDSNKISVETQTDSNANQC